VTRDVAAGALALSRVPQMERPGYADKVAERYAGPSNGRRTLAAAPPPPPPARSSKRPAGKTKVAGKAKTVGKTKTAAKPKRHKPNRK
jgi:hypothetical protein